MITAFVLFRIRVTPWASMHCCCLHPFLKSLVYDIITSFPFMPWVSTMIAEFKPTFTYDIPCQRSSFHPFPTVRLWAPFFIWIWVYFYLLFELQVFFKIIRTYNSLNVFFAKSDTTWGIWTCQIIYISIMNLSLQTSLNALQAIFMLADQWIHLYLNLICETNLASKLTFLCFSLFNYSSLISWLRYDNLQTSSLNLEWIRQVFIKISMLFCLFKTNLTSSFESSHTIVIPIKSMGVFCSWISN